MGPVGGRMLVLPPTPTNVRTNTGDGHSASRPTVVMRNIIVEVLTNDDDQIMHWCFVVKITVI